VRAQTSAYNVRNVTSVPGACGSVPWQQVQWRSASLQIALQCAVPPLSRPNRLHLLAGRPECPIPFLGSAMERGVFTEHRVPVILHLLRRGACRLLSAGLRRAVRALALAVPLIRRLLLRRRSGLGRLALMLVEGALVGVEELSAVLGRSAADGAELQVAPDLAGHLVGHHRPLVARLQLALRGLALVDLQLQLDGRRDQHRQRDDPVHGDRRGIAHGRRHDLHHHHDPLRLGVRTHADGQFHGDRVTCAGGVQRPTGVWRRWRG